MKFRTAEMFQVFNFRMLFGKGLRKGFAFSGLLITALLFFAGPVHAQVPPDSSGKIIISGGDTSRVDSARPIKIMVGGDTLSKKISLAEGEKGSSKKTKKMLKFKGQEEAEVEKVVNRPRTALRRSLVVPGWGQIYNKSAWKFPIIYAGFGAFGYFIYSFNKSYILFKQANLARVDSTSGFTVPEEYSYYTDENLRNARDYYRRYRDLNLILAALWYTLNLVDAFVEAHLDEFDVSDDLSINIDPFFRREQSLNQSSYGMGVTFNLKHNPARHRKPILLR